jgi:hypothetical protein
MEDAEKKEKIAKILPALSTQEIDETDLSLPFIKSAST